MTKRWLVCFGAVVLLSGCATAEKRPTAVKAPVPPPRPQALPLKAIAPALPPEIVPVPDSTDVLVKQVDALYSSGMSDFRAGNLEESKREFDHSLATLLESGLDIQGDERLSSELDRKSVV